MATNIDRAVAKAINKLEPTMLVAFLDSFQDIRSSYRLNKITAALRVGRVDEALRALQISPEFFAPMDAAISQAFREGGVGFVSNIPNNATSSGIVASPRFNSRLPRSETWLRNHINVLAANISNEQALAAREAIVRGISTTQSRSSIALDIIGRVNSQGLRQGGIIGLSGPQINNLTAARVELASGDPKQLRNYLRRSLRDRRFDSKVKEAILSGKPISPKDVARYTGKYSNRMLRARGKVIAHHETIAAANAGRHEGMRQIVDNGVINARQIKRKWNSQGDANVRDTHSNLNGKTVTGIEEPFVSSSGARMMHPHDTSMGAGAAEIANCRCYETTVVKKKSELDVDVLQPTGSFQTTLAVQPKPKPKPKPKKPKPKKPKPVAPWAENIAGWNKLTPEAQANLQKITALTSKDDLVAALAGGADISNVQMVAGKKFLGALVKGADLTMSRRFDLSANIDVGGYAWAKYGFAPGIDEIRGVVGLFIQKVKDLKGVSIQDKQTLLAMLKPRNRDSFWALADSKFGKEIMLGSGWQGELALTDAVAMARFNNYVR